MYSLELQAYVTNAILAGLSELVSQADEVTTENTVMSICDQLHKHREAIISLAEKAKSNIILPGGSNGRQ